MDFSRTGIFDFPNLVRIYEILGPSREADALRCVNKHFYEIGNHPCLRKLTERQKRIIEEIVQLTEDKFQEIAQQRKREHAIHVIRYRNEKNRYGTYTIPAKYVVTSGTGTGKTLIGLYAIKTWRDQGHTILICTNPTQFYIWMDEYKKWCQRYELPEMKVLHPSYTTKAQLQKMTIEPGDVVMVSDALKDKDVAKEGTPSAIIFNLIKKSANIITRGIMDEHNVQPKASAYIAWENPEYFCISMNATKNIRSGIGSNEKQTDEELPSRPRMTVHVKYTDIKPEVLQYYYDCTKGERNLICYENETSVMGGYHEKTPLTDYEFLTKMTTITKKETTKKRIDILEKFKQGKVTELVAPIRFMSKGHNVYPDTMYILVNCNLHRNTLYQLIGRVYRYGSPWRETNVHILFSDYIRFTSKLYKFDTCFDLKLYQVMKQELNVINRCNSYHLLRNKKIKEITDLIESIKLRMNGPGYYGTLFYDYDMYGYQIHHNYGPQEVEILEWYRDVFLNKYLKGRASIQNGPDIHITFEP